MAFLNIFKKNKGEKPVQPTGAVKTDKKIAIPPLKDEAVKSKPVVPPLKTEAQKKTTVPPVKKAVRKIAGRAHQILIKPLVTEKATNLGAENKYVFAVVDSANKIEVNKAIQGLYGVTPIAINIINLPGKKVRYGRVEGQTKGWKKAIITLKKGEVIKVFEGV